METAFRLVDGLSVNWTGVIRFGAVFSQDPYRQLHGLRENKARG